MTRWEVQAHVAGFPAGATRSPDVGDPTSGGPWAGPALSRRGSHAIAA